jgi:hypothetical protein
MLLSVAVYASITLASLPALYWCHLPHCAGVFVRHHSHCGIVVVPGLIVINCISQHCCLWWLSLVLRWHCLPHGAGIFALIALASSPLSHWHLRAHDLPLHAALSLHWCPCCTWPHCRTCHLQPHHHIWHCCCAGIIFCAQPCCCTRCCRYPLQWLTHICHSPAAAADGLGLGNA